MPKALSEDFLIKEFWRYVNTYQTYPTRSDIAKANGYPSDKGYARLWGDWDNFLKHVGLIRFDNNDGWYKHDEDVLNKYYESNNIIPEYIIGKLLKNRSWDCIKRKASKMGLSRTRGKKREYSKSDVIEEINRFYNRYNRVPTHDDFRNNNDFISTKVVKSRFGSWNKAIESAGFSPNLIRVHDKAMVVDKAMEFYQKNGRSPYYNEIGLSRSVVYSYWDSWGSMLEDIHLPPTPKMYGSHSVDINGNVHKSKIETVISNILISNNIVFSLEDRYDEFIDVNVNYKFDWVISIKNKRIFVEYFGLDAPYKRNEIDKYKDKILHKTIICEDNGLELLSLNQNDIADNFRGLVSKFKKYGVNLIIDDEFMKQIGYRVKRIKSTTQI